MPKHCLDDLASLRQYAAGYYCTECAAEFQLGQVVEALRVRAVAQDAAERLKHIGVDEYHWSLGEDL